MITQEDGCQDSALKRALSFSCKENQSFEVPVENVNNEHPISKVDFPSLNSLKESHNSFYNAHMNLCTQYKWQRHTNGSISRNDTLVQVRAEATERLKGPKNSVSSFPRNKMSQIPFLQTAYNDWC